MDDFNLSIVRDTCKPSRQTKNGVTSVVLHPILPAKAMAYANLPVVVDARDALEVPSCKMIMRRCICSVSWQDWQISPQCRDPMVFGVQ